MYHLLSIFLRRLKQLEQSVQNRSNYGQLQKDSEAVRQQPEEGVDVFIDRLTLRSSIANCACLLCLCFPFRPVAASEAEHLGWSNSWYGQGRFSRLLQPGEARPRRSPTPLVAHQQPLLKSRRVRPLLCVVWYGCSSCTPNLSVRDRRRRLVVWRRGRLRLCT